MNDALITAIPQNASMFFNLGLFSLDLSMLNFFPLFMFEHKM